MSDSKAWKCLTASDLRDRIPACGNVDRLIEVAADIGVLENLLQALVLAEERLRLQVPSEVPPQEWRRQRWGHAIHESFIAARPRLESVSFWSARIRQKGLAMELYYQLCNGESRLENRALVDGSIVLNSKKPIHKLPKPIQKTLRGAKAGLALPPIRVSDDYLVLEVCAWHPAELDEATEALLLEELELAWVDRELKRRLEHLTDA